MKRNHSRLKTTVIGLVMVMLGVFFLPCPVRAQEEKTLRVAMLEYPNFMNVDENGNPYGFACEYLEDIAKYTGWKYEYVPMAFSDAEKALQKGEIDILPGSQYTPEREALYDFGKYPMSDNSNVLCVKADNTQYYYNDIQSFEGMRIGTLEGSVRSGQFKEVLDEQKISVEFYPYKSNAQQKEALEKGEVDAILIASIRCTNDFKIIASTNISELYFTCNPLDHSIKEQLDMAQENILSQNPYYNYKLYENYYGDIPLAYAFTEDEREYMSACEPLTVAVSSDMKPYEYYDEKSGSFGGFVISYFNKISEITGISFKYVIRGEAEETKEKLEQGQLQLISSVVNNSDTQEIYPIILSKPYYSGTTEIAANNSVKDPYDSACSIVLKDGFPQYKMLAQKQGYQNIIYCNTFEECVEMVNDGKADITFLPGYSADRILDHPYLNKITIQTVPVFEFTCSIGISDQCDPRLVSILDKAFSSIENKEKNKIILSAMINNEDPVTLRDLLYGNMMVILTVLLLFFLVILLIVLRNNMGKRAINKQLSEAKEAAEQASVAKSEFLSRMSHDMRTPLNAIMGMTYLSDESTSLEEVKCYMKKIYSSGEYLEGLINDTLDMSKMDSDKVVLNPQPFYQTELVNTLNTLFTDKAKKKDITFTVLAHSTNRPIMFDKLRLQQVLFNLINNAIHFTPNGGKVEVEINGKAVSPEQIEVTFIVRDNGIGMSKEFQKKMYNAFEQEHASAGVDGTGLGLSIVKKLVDIQKGTISCKSETAKGTEFTVIFTVPVAQDQNIKAAESWPEENLNVLKGKHILMCEDHPLNIQIAKKLLEKKEMTVTVAENGKIGTEIFAAAKEHEFDAVLMDIRMPQMDGLEAAKVIRSFKREDAKTIPIIAMTANAYEEDVKKSLEAGMNAHLAKPIDPEKLYQILAGFLSENK